MFMYRFIILFLLSPLAYGVAPTISTVAADTSTSAVITWTVSEASDGQVEYGTTTAYGTSTVKETQLLTNHAAVLPDLVRGTLYHFRIKSANAAEELATSSDYAFIAEEGSATVNTPCPVLDVANAVSDSGFAWKVTGDFGTPSDNNLSSLSILQLFEDGEELGPAHSYHVDIRNIGLGRFSHKSDDAQGNGEAIRFSASDNTDPRSNGRIYTYCADAELPDTIPPTAPTNLTAVPGDTSVALAWTASTDNTAVTGYQILKDEAVIGTTAGTTYTATNLAANSSYTFKVTAYDAAGNTSEGASVVASMGCAKTTIDMTAAVSDTGYAWRIAKNFGTPPDNSTGGPSILRLFENGAELGPAHSYHVDIRTKGLGRFSHKSDSISGAGEALRFSASDNTNPKTNGRTYTTCTGATPPPPPPVVVVPGASFPGAMGGGAAAKGGRGGAVIEVTNLNDSGTGSLRACIQASGPRTCVFRVGGTINISSSLSVNNPYLTVAGQTAPGGGILIKGSGINMVKINASDVIWRYTKIRHGYNTACSDSSTSECGQTMMVFGSNIMVDHNSTSWNQDEGIGSWGWSGSSPSNITISSNLVAEGLIAHSTGFIAGGSNANSQVNIDYIGNLIMNNSHRNPLLKNKSSRIVNNIFYNNRRYANQFMGGISVDVIGNLFKKGPMFGQYAPNAWDWHEVQVATSPGVDSPNTNTSPTSPRIYLSGNKGWNQTNPNGDQWALTAHVPGENNAEQSSGAIATTYRRTVPLADTVYPITAISVDSLDANIVPTVGASRRLACDGTWVANRDAVDSRLVGQYQTNTGISSIPTRETDVGGFPTISGGTACTDTDHDGMPDTWETAKGLNPNSAADRNTVGANGYTNLELYLAGP